jgi:hypothetical protein
MLLSPTQDRHEELEHMLHKMTKDYLKETWRLLGYYDKRATTNAEMADFASQYLEWKAKTGSDLRAERRIVKDVFSKCYGGCGFASDSDGGSDGEAPNEVTEPDEPFDEEAANVSLKIVAKATGLRTDAEQKRMDDLEAMVAKMSRKYLKRLMRALAMKGPISGTDEELQVFAPKGCVLSAL